MPMVVGSLRANGWKIKSEPLKVFNLGTGHLNWFKSRLHYLWSRHQEVKIEMVKRGFKCDALSIEKDKCPSEFWNNWEPTIEDSMKLRGRLEEKLRANKLPITWWRYNRVNLSSGSVEAFINQINQSELFYV